MAKKRFDAGAVKCADCQKVEPMYRMKWLITTDEHLCHVCYDKRYPSTK